MGLGLGLGGLGHELRDSQSCNNGSRRPTGWLPINLYISAHIIFVFGRVRFSKSVFQTPLRFSLSSKPTVAHVLQATTFARFLADRA